jgi:hypothetical protein
MTNKFLIIPLALVLLIAVAATGCSSGVTNEQYMSLQSQVNSLNNSLTSTQQQLSSTQQQLAAAQQSLTQAQSQQQLKTYTTYSQPEPVYQPTIIYRTYPYVYQPYPHVTPWYQPPFPPRPPMPPHPPMP